MDSITDGTSLMLPRFGLMLIILWSQLVNLSSIETQKTTLQKLNNLHSLLVTLFLVWNLLWIRCFKVVFSPTLILIVTDLELTMIKFQSTAHIELKFQMVNVMDLWLLMETKVLSLIMNPVPSTTLECFLKLSLALKELLVWLVTYIFISWLFLH